MFSLKYKELTNNVKYNSNCHFFLEGHNSVQSRGGHGAIGPLFGQMAPC